MSFDCFLTIFVITIFLTLLPETIQEKRKNHYTRVCSCLVSTVSRHVRSTRKKHIDTHSPSIPRIDATSCGHNNGLKVYLAITRSHCSNLPNGSCTFSHFHTSNASNGTSIGQHARNSTTTSRKASRSNPGASSPRSSPLSHFHHVSIQALIPRWCSIDHPFIRHPDKPTPDVCIDFCSCCLSLPSIFAAPINHMNQNRPFQTWHHHGHPLHTTSRLSFPSNRLL